MRALSNSLRLAGCCCVLACAAALARAEAAPPDEAVLSMVEELVRSPDREMRGLGLKQIREGLPGEAITRRFADLSASLPVEAQVAMLEALGDRGDPAARPALVKAAASADQSARVAAIAALGLVGNADDVPLVVEKAAAGGAESKAARQSLARLKGEKIDAAMIAALDQAAPAVQIEVLRALAARKARQAAPAVLKKARHPDASVRRAALAAARVVLAEKDLADVIRLVVDAQDRAERSAAEPVLLAICGRDNDVSADLLARALEAADPAARSVFVRALGANGSPKALAAVQTQQRRDVDPTVRGEAMRVLAAWPNRAATPRLVEIAREPIDLDQQVLAMRGLVRLAQAQGSLPADLAILGEVMKLAQRPDEKRLVLGAIGGVPTTAALALARPALDDSVLVEEAALAVLAISEKLPPSDRPQVEAAMRQLLERCQEPDLRRRAESLLKKQR